MSNIMNVTYASSLTDLKEINSSFDTGVLKICYPGQNRNGSFISKENLSSHIDSLYNCPIVCRYDRESDSIGGHDVDVVASDNGSLKLVNATSPVGVIPESSNVRFENVTENDGTVREYLVADVLLWKRQEAYQKIKDDGFEAQSMEINVNSGEVIDGVYHINDFEFTAFCLLGSGIEPCFESASLELFSKQEFKNELAQMMQELKESYNLINTSIDVANKHPQEISTEGGEKVLDKQELIVKYGIDVESLDFSIDDFTVEELEEKFAAMTSNEELPDQEDNEEPESDNGEEFELAGNDEHELRLAIGAEKINRPWGDEQRYWMLDYDPENGEVYCEDSQDWKIYGFKYSKNGDAINVDFASCKRKKKAFVDFEGDEQMSVAGHMFEVAEQLANDNADILAKYQKASETIESINKELEELRQFKTDVENATAQAERDNVFAMFEDLVGVEAFDNLKENCADIDVATLEEKCFAIRGRNASTAKFGLESKTPVIKVDKTDTKNEPYGGIVERYKDK